MTSIRDLRMIALYLAATSLQGWCVNFDAHVSKWHKSVQEVVIQLV